MVAGGGQRQVVHIKNAVVQQAAEIFAHAGVKRINSHFFHVNNLQFSLIALDKADRAIVQRAGAAAAF